MSSSSPSDINVKIRVATHPGIKTPMQTTLPAAADFTVDDFCNQLMEHELVTGYVTVIVMNGRRWSSEKADVRRIADLKNPVALITCSRPLDIVRASFRPSAPFVSPSTRHTAPFPQPPDSSVAAPMSPVRATRTGAFPAPPPLSPLASLNSRPQHTAPLPSSLPTLQPPPPPAGAVFPPGIRPSRRTPSTGHHLPTVSLLFGAACPTSGLATIPVRTVDTLCSKWLDACSCVAWTDDGPCGNQIAGGWYCADHDASTDIALRRERPHASGTAAAAAAASAPAPTTGSATTATTAAPPGNAARGAAAATRRVQCCFPGCCDEVAAVTLSAAAQPPHPAAAASPAPTHPPPTAPTSIGASLAAESDVGDVGVSTTPLPTTTFAPLTPPTTPLPTLTPSDIAACPGVRRYCSRCIVWRHAMFPLRAAVSAAACDPRSKLPIAHVVCLSPAATSTIRPAVEAVAGQRGGPLVGGQLVGGQKGGVGGGGGGGGGGYVEEQADGIESSPYSPTTCGARRPANAMIPVTQRRVVSGVGGDGAGNDAGDAASGGGGGSARHTAHPRRVGTPVVRCAVLEVRHEGCVHPVFGDMAAGTGAMHVWASVPAYEVCEQFGGPSRPPTPPPALALARPPAQTPTPTLRDDGDDGVDAAGQQAVEAVAEGTPTPSTPTPPPGAPADVRAPTLTPTPSPSPPLHVTGGDAIVGPVAIPVMWTVVGAITFGDDVTTGMAAAVTTASTTAVVSEVPFVPAVPPPAAADGTARPCVSVSVSVNVTAVEAALGAAHVSFFTRPNGTHYSVVGGHAFFNIGAARRAAVNEAIAYGLQQRDQSEQLRQRLLEVSARHRGAVKEGAVDEEKEEKREKDVAGVSPARIPPTPCAPTEPAPAAAAAAAGVSGRRGRAGVGGWAGPSRIVCGYDNGRMGSGDRGDGAGADVARPAPFEGCCGGTPLADGACTTDACDDLACDFGCDVDGCDVVEATPMVPLVPFGAPPPTATNSSSRNGSRNDSGSGSGSGSPGLRDLSPTPLGLGACVASDSDDDGDGDGGCIIQPSRTLAAIPLITRTNTNGNAGYTPPAYRAVRRCSSSIPTTTTAASGIGGVGGAFCFSPMREFSPDGLSPSPPVKCTPRRALSDGSGGCGTPCGLSSLRVFPPSDTAADAVSPTAGHVRGDTLSRHVGTCSRCSSSAGSERRGGCCE